MPWALRTLMMICLIALPVFLYVSFRLAASIGLVWPGWGPRARLGLLLVVAWLYALPAATFVMYRLEIPSSALLSGTTANWADYLLHYPTWTGIIIVLELVAPLILADLIQLVFRLVPSAYEPVRMFLAWTRVVLAAVAVVYISSRVVLDTFWVRDSSADVQVEGLPAELEGFRISLVGDIQVDRYTGPSKVEQVHRIVEGRAPEMLVSSGDLVTSGREYLEAAREAVCGMQGTFATIAVLGDHDIWSAPADIRRIHEQCGWEFLDNEHRLLRYRGRTVLVTGLTHVYSERLPPEALDTFLAEAPRADLRILLVHQPAERVVHLAALHGYHLMLAGHTHGGQIVFHPLGIPLTPSMRETRFYSGVYRSGGTTVVVTRGVGLTLAPVRYHSPAEVSTVVLRRAP